MKPSRKALSRSAIHQFGVDGRLWHDMCEESPRLRKAVEDGVMDHGGTWSELMSDTYLTLYKAEPQLRDISDMEKAFQAHHPIISGLMEDPEVQSLRADTKLNDMLSAVGTLALTEKLRDAIKNTPELSDWWDRQWESAPPPGDEPGDGNAAAEASEGEEPIEIPAAVKKLLRSAAHKAIKEAEQEVADTEGAFRSWGHETQELQMVPIEERLDLADRLKAMPKLRDIARLVGRLKNLRRGLEARNMSPGHEEIFGVTQGDHVDRALPSELALLAHPTARRLFQARFLEHQLLEYALRGREPAGIGPMIILIDISDSTRGPVEIWEKGLALALVQEAQRQHRAAMVIGFDTQVKATIEWSPACTALEDLEKIQRTASMWSGGGTNWSNPIMKGLDHLNTATWKYADLVLLTDGKDKDLRPDVRDSLNAARARGLRFISVVVKDSPPLYMHDWSDRVLQVYPNDTAAETVFQEVLKPFPRKGESEDGHHA